jgi:PAS domain S-box-containing protein
MARDRPEDPGDQEHRFQTLVNAVIDYAIYMIDANGSVATWNAGARRFKGYEAGDIIGRPYETFFLPEDRAAGLPGRILATAANEGRFEGEGWRLRKDGSRFWAHVVVDPIRDESGALIGYAKVTRDLTERRASERALFESEQRFRMLVQSVRDYAIYMLDPDGRVSNWNAGAEAIKGYSEQEIVGQHFSRFYTEEDREGGEPARALETALREGKYEREAWRLRKDGTRFWASVLIEPVYAADGRLSGFAKVTRDITERREAEEELETARAALFQSQKMQALGELTGGIAHDFNNLLTVIRGSAELLQRPGLSDEKRARYLASIVETSDRATSLTSHLLAFGRRQALRPEVLDLNPRLDAFAEVIGRTFGNQIEIALDLESGLPAVEVDTTQLETALLNAAINARDAMPEGGVLTLSTRNVAEAGQVCVGLADSGEGIDAEILQRVFEPFFTTKQVGKGTGLGLSQIHGFAAQMGGRAEIESIAGKGTKLRIFLPSSDKHPEASAKAQASQIVPTGLRVLLVEDNDQVRQFAQNLLGELQCEVSSAACGEEAIELLERESFDLLFSDVVMPGMSGVELAALVRERYPNLPVLLASGYSNELFRGAAADLDIVPKPYGAAALSKGLATVLGRREQAA